MSADQPQATTAIDAGRIEEAGLNAMQTQRQLFYDGWLLRLSPGKAKRGRSVNAHFGSTLPLPAKIAYCETLYRHHGLPALFRITPFTQPPALDRVLGERGYAAFETTLVQAASLEARPEPDALPDGVALTETDVTTFVDVIGDLRGSPASQRAAHRERLENSPLGKRMIVLRADDRIVCAAQIAIEDDLAGVYDVVTAEAARGNGYATAGLHGAAGVGGAARRAHRVPAGQCGQLAGTRDLSQARVRDAVHVPLPRRAGRTSMNDALFALAVALGRTLQRHGLCVATAESCTGGLIAGAITDVAGSSGWFDRGFVTYSNEAKIEMLGVQADTLAAHGAVSEATAAEMAAGALARSGADLAVAVTGVAGPDGGSATKPVGTVCFAWARAGEPVATATRHFPGDREAVRAATVCAALQGLIDRSD